MFEHGAFAIRGRDIVAVGRAADVEASVAPARRISAEGAAVHPGFVECHNHTTLHTARGAFGDTISWNDVVPEFYVPYWNTVTDDEEYAGAALAVPRDAPQRHDLLRRGGHGVRARGRRAGRVRDGHPRARRRPVPLGHRRLHVGLARRSPARRTRPSAPCACWAGSSGATRIPTRSSAATSRSSAWRPPPTSWNARPRRPPTGRRRAQPAPELLRGRCRRRRRAAGEAPAAPPRGDRRAGAELRVRPHEHRARGRGRARAAERDGDLVERARVDDVGHRRRDERASRRAVSDGRPRGPRIGLVELGELVRHRPCGDARDPGGTRRAEGSIDPDGRGRAHDGHGQRGAGGRPGGPDRLARSRASAPTW